MKKAVVLVMSCIVAVILLVLTSAFMSGVISEKYFADNEKRLVQAINISEAGVNHGLEELRNIMQVALNEEVGNHRSSNAFIPYTDDNPANKDSLDFLCDFLNFSYLDASTDKVGYNFDSTTLPASAHLNNLGTYSGRIIIQKQVDDSGNVIEAYPADSDNPNVFVFPYEFIVEVSGSATGVGKTVRVLQGVFQTTVQRANFARFALFTNHHRSPGGTTVWFTGDTKFYGPVHSNDRFSFALAPSGYFTDEVTQHLKKARFYNGGRSKLLDADSNPPRDVPTFEEGFQRSVPLLNLESAVTQNDLRSQALGAMTEPGQNGIYVPNDGVQTTGGIYIRGDSKVQLGSNGSKAVYTIEQGSWTNKETKEVSVDYSTNQTQVKTYNWRDNLVEDVTYNGIPDGVEDEGVIIFGKGDIESLSGIVQKDSQVTVSSQDDIIIDGHIRYEEHDTSPNINAEEYTNLLGILSWGGDVRVGTSAPSNLDVHGVIMAPHGVFTVDNYRWRSPSGNVNLLGGVITDFYGPFGTFSGDTQRSGYGRNFIYDRRMLGAMSPPYYPTATDFMAVTPLLDREMKSMGFVWEEVED